MAKRIPLKKARQLYQKQIQYHQNQLSLKPNPSRKNKHLKTKHRLRNFITGLKLRWYHGNRQDLVMELEKDEDAS